MNYIDLHTHTTASDGTFTPSEVVRLAVELGIKALAITDHDTIDGIEEALLEGSKLGLEIIPGIEISVDFVKEMHILGYFIDLNCLSLKATLDKLQDFRRKRNPLIVQRLQKLGFNITLQEVLETAGGESVGRPHIGKVLMDKGYVKSISEAFEKYLAVGKPAYLEKEKLSPKEAIGIIIKAGGIPVLAHPKFLQLDEVSLGEILLYLTNLGLKGIEAYYSTHSLEETKQYLRLAEKYNLAVSGGSDFHGSNKPEIILGRGTEGLPLDNRILVNFKNHLNLV